MNKTELIEKIAITAGVDLITVRKVLDTMINEIDQEVKIREQRVILTGFGTFSLAEVAPGKRAAFGSVIKVEGKKRIKFTAARGRGREDESDDRGFEFLLNR